MEKKNGIYMFLCSMNGNHRLWLHHFFYVESINVVFGIVMLSENIANNNTVQIRRNFGLQKNIWLFEEKCGFGSVKLWIWRFYWEINVSIRWNWIRKILIGRRLKWIFINSDWILSVFGSNLKCIFDQPPFS